MKADDHNIIDPKKDNCDKCINYEWYYDKCKKLDCEVDPRSVCSLYEPRDKNK